MQLKEHAHFAAVGNGINCVFYKFSGVLVRRICDYIAVEADIFLEEINTAASVATVDKVGGLNDVPVVTEYLCKMTFPAGVFSNPFMKIFNLK